MKILSFRAPGAPPPLDALLARAWPAATSSQRHAAIEGGRVEVEAVSSAPGRARRLALTDPDHLVEPGAALRAEVEAGQLPPAPAPITTLAAGDGWTVVLKPVGWPCQPPRPTDRSAQDLVAEQLGLDLDAVLPAHRLDRDVGGAWLIAHDRDTARHLGLAFEQRRVQKRYLAVALAPLWREGLLTRKLNKKKSHTRFRVLEIRDQLALLELEPLTGRTHQLRRHAADAGFPLLADPLYGGRLVAGGLRLVSVGIDVPSLGIHAEAPLPEGFWPDEPVTPPGRGWRKAPILPISEATVRALRRGHPWVLTDTETGDVGRHCPGTHVRLRGAQGGDGGRALTEGAGALAAHLWSPPGHTRRPRSIEARVHAAFDRRAELLADPTTTSVRIIHHAADGLPGLIVDRLGPILRVLIQARAAQPLLHRALLAITGRLAGELGPHPPIVEVIHLKDPPPGELTSVRWRQGDRDALAWHDAERFEVLERGLRFLVAPGLERPLKPRPGVGLFMDQRANRARVVAEAAERGGRWLNLFAHTGAFSVALLAAGADAVTSVDLSGPYLQWLEDNLRLNDLPLDRHLSVKNDVRHALDRLDPGERFHGIVLDPPTAAAAGRAFWSVKKGAGELVEACLRLLEPNGVLLLSRNDRGARGSLEPLVREAAKAVGRRVTELEGAPPDVDFPMLEGFPEGDAFAGVWARVR